MRFSLPAFALRRPITIIMISITMLSLGTIAWFRMPLQFLPDVSPPFINAQIPYPGASPAQVEQEIAIPVEGEFRTIPGLRSIRTISDANGCFVNMRFNLDTNMALATAEVRDRMERLKLVLPPEVDRMYLQRFSSRSIPIVAFGMFHEGDDDEFISRVRSLAEPRLRRIDGVADVVIFATQPEKEVVIEFDQTRLRSLNIALFDLVGALRESSLNVSVGELADGGTKNFVRAIGEYRKLEDLRDIIVNPEGLRLSEVADVRYTTRDENQHVEIDGQGGAFLLAIKEAEANTVATAEAVLAEIELLKLEPQFQDSQFYVFFNQAKLIQDALQNLLDAGKFGGLMALCVLFVFMHRFRPTLIVACTIPTALVVALVVMFFAGMSINLVTMVSMIIAIGLLVDNAIVVVENIVRYRQLGLNRFESSKRGATEVGLAITAATSTTGVVFLPMFYMETGRMSVFMRELAVPMTVSLGASLLIALTLIPLAMSRIGERHEMRIVQWLAKRNAGRTWRDRLGPFQFLADLRPIKTTLNTYGAALGLVLRWRVAAFLMLGGILYLTYAIPLQAVGMQDLPQLDTRQIIIDARLEQNFDMDMTREVFVELQQELDGYREELGIRSIFKFFSRNSGKFEIYLYTEDDDPKWKYPPYSTEEARDFLMERIPALRPGVELTFSLADAGQSGGTSRDVSLNMRGDHAAELEQYAERFMETMRAHPELIEVTSSVERVAEEMQLRIDAPLAAREGISPIAIAQTVDIALRGARLPYMKQGSREIPVWAQFREEDRKSRENLDNIAVSSMTGELVPLKQLVDYSRAHTPSAIQRVNSKNVITIYAQSRTEDLGRIDRDLRELADQFELPAGYTIEMGDELREIQANYANFLITLLMSVMLIYLVMCALFESYLYPLSILTTVPLAFIGSYWLLYLTSTPLDVVTLIGCILMVGLIVNNGIVIIDHINQLRQRMPNRNDAIVQAGMDRFRPVMMTAITTILGCLPLAMAQSGGAVTFAGMGRALIGGLAVGTLLTLMIVPLVYSILDDIRQWSTNYFGGLLALRQGGVAAAQPGQRA